MEHRPWTIWAEGFVETGGRGQATILGHSNGETFDEAVAAFVGRLKPADAQYYHRTDDGVWYMWGCRLFDNESDARKSFG